MLGEVAISTPLWLSAPCIPPRNCNSIPRICFLRRNSNPTASFSQTQYFSHLSSYPLHLSPFKDSKPQAQLSPNAASSSSVEYTEEPTTNVKFQRSLSLPGCSSSLSLIGTGYREKVFAIIGVKIYAAGLYVNQSILFKLNAWKGKSAAEIQENSSLFNSIFQSPLEKSLQIVLVRDVDGKTFWDALDDAISPRIKAPTSIDELALSTFRSIFQGRPLKKGTFIFLTWLDPSKMLVCVSSDGLPASVDAEIESENVTLALFDVFFGNTPVSPSLKDSVASGLATILK
ncbi:fatty-acid-binding protein 3, chloroplastic isoform X1 [Juglans microcarpa x Juglans regia]|uniref:fatty-acid-binding protein 3, chloroplastic isoform X1 n=1 Tax=Juglans microcarpa x Juglans regia TaxID=2249226 RepID=UPI001B7DED0D|nr:fatty-acid-binding protein 3, chloroplastic isoform X1 [Juglans microcarpa x Juglans regia]